MTIASQSQTGTYSATATTLTLTFTGNSTGNTFQVLYVKPSAAGVPTDINLVGISSSNNSCTSTGHFSLN